jgi:hypothetical protein
MTARVISIDGASRKSDMTRLPFADVQLKVRRGRFGEYAPLGRSDDEGGRMCANCGCGIPEDKHGDERNINWSEIVASAEANDISPQQAVQNIQDMAQRETA